jgi:hypothetical protein
MYQVWIQLTNDAGAPYPSHRIAALFSRRVASGSDEPEDDLWIPAEVTTSVGDDGSAQLTFPNKQDMTGDVNFRVIAPDGEILYSSLVSVQNLTPEMEIEVEPKAFFDVEPNPDPDYGKPAKIRGRAIDAANRVQIAQKQVVLWGSTVEDPQAADFQPLVVAKTDPNGYFSAPYPLGSYTDAYGVVGIGDGVTVPIRLEDEGAFPEYVLLAVAVDEDEDIIVCNKEVPHAPDSRDLTTADGTFTTDLGIGRCVDFNKPNRTLEQFSFYYAVRTTEPEIRAITLEEPPTIPLGAVADKLEILLSLSEQGEPEHGPTEDGAPPSEGLRNLANMVKVLPSELALNATTLQSAVRDLSTLSTDNLVYAAKSSIHQDLVRAIAQYAKMAPTRSRLSCARPVDWDHEPTLHQACTVAHGHLLHFVQEWVADGYSLGDLLYSLPLAPCQKKQIVVLDWERRESAARVEELSEEERMAATLSRDRDISEIVNASLAESSEGGSWAKNKAAGGGLGFGFLGKAIGGLLGIGGGASKSEARAWQRSSRRTAASSLQQLRDRTAQAASAVRNQRSTVIQTVRQGERVSVETEVVANHNHCHAMTVQYFEVLRHLLVRQRLVDVQECLFVPLMMGRFTFDKVLRWRDTLSRYLRDRRLRKGFNAIERITNHYVGSNLPIGAYADGMLEYLQGDLYLRFQIARPRDDETGEFLASSWEWRYAFGGILGLIFDPSEFYNTYLKEQAFKDRVFQRELAPKIAANFVELLKFEGVKPDGTSEVLPIDPTLISTYRANRRHYVSLRLAEDLPALHRKDIEYIRINCEIQEGGQTGTLADVLPAGSRVIVEAGNMSYRTEHMSGYLFRSNRIANDLTGSDHVLIATPLNRRELRRPRDEDREAARLLLAHLNEQLEYYHHAIWTEMSPARRYMLLDGFEAPNSGHRSVASVVENRVIGIAGNCLIMPVSRGFKLDPTYNQDEENPVDLLEHYEPNTPIEPIPIAVPTKGVFAEAVMGACNSCEHTEDDRFWRWEESPCPDEPPAIQPVSTESRRAEPPDLEAKDFPAPMINLQNAPAAPDPTGLAAALQLIGKPDLFRDITGLTETQKSALAALQAAFDSAKFFGGQAANLALQGKMAKDIDKTLKTIQKAKDQKLISADQAKSLTESALKAMVGGGTKPTQADLQAIQKARELGLLDKKQAADLAELLMRKKISGQAGTARPLTDTAAVQKKIEQAKELEATRDGESVKVKTGEATTATQTGFALSASVGKGGVNKPEDVNALRQHLIRLGYDALEPTGPVDDNLKLTINLLQSIVRGRTKIQGDQVIDVPGLTYQWLQASNAPRWQKMPSGGLRSHGYSRRTDPKEPDAPEEILYGPHWMANTIRAAGLAYRDSHLLDHPQAAILAYIRVGPSHDWLMAMYAALYLDDEHYSAGMGCALLLPKTDKQPGAPNTGHASYDRDAMRAQLQALKKQPLVNKIYLDDATLVAEGLCEKGDVGSDRAYFTIKAPDRK